MGALQPYFPEIRSSSVSSIRLSFAFTYVGLRKMLYEFPEPCPQIGLWFIMATSIFSPQLDFQKNIYLNPTPSASDRFSSLRSVQVFLLVSL